VNRRIGYGLAVARRVSSVLLVVALTVVTLGVGFAAAPRMFGRLERVEVEPYFAGLARVRVWLNLMMLEGSLITDVKPDELQLVTSGTRHRQIPGVQFYDQRDDLTDMVVVVETHSSFAAAFEDLEEPLYRFLSKLPKSTTRVSLVTYGEEVKKQTPLADPMRAARKWKRLMAEDVPSPPQLVEALEDAVKVLAGAQPTRPVSSHRKLIIVISDGNDNDIQAPETRDEFRRIVKQAQKADVVFHTIAFSFLDNREPFLNLGEISKKTNGTFRWARNRKDFENLLPALEAEIKRQMVLTFFVAPDVIEAKAVKIVCKSSRCGSEALESNELRAPQMRCGGEVCSGEAACVEETCMTAAMVGAGGGGGGVWIALGLVVLAGGGGAVLVRKMRRAAAAADLAAAASANEAAAGAPAMPPNVVVPDYSKVPYLAGSAGVAQLNQNLANMPYVGQYQQQLQQQAPRAPVAAPAGKVAQIMVLSGPKQGQTLPLRHGFTIGRTPGCDLVIEDGMTSGYHAQFHLDTAGGVTVVDLGSSNGTYVNGVRSQSSRLAHGMSLRVGQTDLRFLQG
jgi:hypothetical protein